MALDYSSGVNYEWLFSFERFAEHCNFTRAAEELHISQPALHVQIKKLSEMIGVPLYHRRGRALYLSPEGEKLAAYAREAREQGQRVLADVRGETTIGPVVLAAGQGAFLYLLGPAIRRFPKDRWPLRLLSMSGPDALDALRSSRAHVAVAVLEDPPDDLVTERLRDVGQQVVVPTNHRLAGRRRVTLEALDGEQLIVAPTGSPHRVALTQALRTAGVDWTVAVEATGWQLMLHFARNGMGITVVNDFCTIPRGMVGVPLQGIPPVSYHAVRRARQPDEPVQALLALIRRTLHD